MLGLGASYYYNGNSGDYEFMRYLAMIFLVNLPRCAGLLVVKLRYLLVLEFLQTCCGAHCHVISDTCQVY